MKKQKNIAGTDAHVQAARLRRIGWLSVLIIGLFSIQAIYNFHGGHPQVLGYAVEIESKQLLEETNQYRARHGLPELNYNPALSKAAEAKAKDMATKNYWEHKTPEGISPWMFLEHAGYSYQSAGENLAYGFLSSSEVVNAWSNSKTHQENMLGEYRDVGFGVIRAPGYQGGDNVIVVAFYGTAANSPFVTKAVKSAATHNNTSHYVNGLAVVATGGANWAMYASFGLLGAATIGFIVTHLELMKLGWYRSKRYLALHPVIDLVVIVVIAMALIYTAGGFIL